MTVKELKEKLNNFDDNMIVEFRPLISIEGQWNYPTPYEEEDASRIDVYEHSGKCVLENAEVYYPE